MADALTSSPVLPTSADVDAAARRLAGVALRTPLVTSPVLDAATGARVFLKAETLQRTGSFKFRGAYNKLASLPAERRKGGVVAFSSGNHAQGVAAAAKLLDMPATIVMPSDAPKPKRDRTAAPEGFDDTARSFESGKHEKNARMSGTICDALMSNTPGNITFPINRKLIGAGITASDEEVGRAVSFAFRELKLVVEPGGAIGLAALLAGRVDVKGKVVVAVLSGGNVDPELFHRLVA